MKKSVLWKVLLLVAVAFCPISWNEVKAEEEETPVIEEGYYFIMPTLSYVGNALCHNATGSEEWRVNHLPYTVPIMLGTKDKAYIFYIEPKGKSCYTIKNMENNLYIGYNGTNGRGEGLGWTKTATAFTFTYFPEKESWNMVDNTRNLPHGGAVMVQGENVCGYWGTDADNCMYRFEPVDVSQIEESDMTDYNDILKEANRVLGVAHGTGYDEEEPLITDVNNNDGGQFYAPQEPDAKGNYSNFTYLIDGKTSTCFQSTWSSSVCKSPQPFQVDLKDNPVQDFVFVFGLRDGNWGYVEQWKNVTLYATNDESLAKQAFGSFDASKWDKLGNLTDFPTEWDANGSDRYFTYEVSGLAKKSYRFYRFVINSTITPQSNMMYTIGEFQMYELKSGGENSPYNKLPELKTEADKLQQMIDAVEKSYTDGTLTRTQLKDLLAQASKVDQMTPSTDRIENLIADVKAFLELATIGEEVGEVTQEQYDEMVRQLEIAEGYMLDVNDMQEKIKNLQAAYELFMSQMVSFEIGKWYYIVNAENEKVGHVNQGGESIKEEDAWTYGSYLYAASNNSRTAHWDMKTDALRNGLFDYLYNRVDKGIEHNPYAMWRFVKTEDGYGIQNRATGKFIGDFSVSGRGGMENTPVAYKIKFASSKQLQFICTLSSKAKALTAYYNGYIQTEDGGANSPSCWSLKKVDDEALGNYVNLSIPDNSIQIMTLPYQVESKSEMNEESGVKLYSVRRISPEGELELTEKQTFEAGEPFIAVAGDYLQESDGTTNLAVAAPNDYVTEAKDANGLVGVLDYTKVSDTRMGYFVDSEMKPVVGEIGLNGFSGYLNPATVNYTNESVDLRINISAIIPTAIRSIATDNGEKVNVYSISGNLLKQNVERSDAGRNLGRGIYIIGNRKISIAE